MVRTSMARRRERTRMGRPAEFRARARMTVLLEDRELRALHKLAERHDVSASRFVRTMIQTALTHAREH